MTKPHSSVVVADDHPIVLRGIVELLRSTEDMDVIGTFHNGRSALDGIRKHDPDLAVLDISMPDLSGLDVLDAIAGEKRLTKVVFLTASITDGQVLTAFARGAKAILLKDTVPDDLVRCVRTVAEGSKWFPADLVDAALQRATGRRFRSGEIVQTLTAREREIMCLVAEGLANKEVAWRLGVSEGTVKIHLHNIYRKVGVQNRTALSVFAFAHAGEFAGRALDRKPLLARRQDDE
jgi:DNA-binding NarL/FixJ family response regulator